MPLRFHVFYWYAESFLVEGLLVRLSWMVTQRLGVALFGASKRLVMSVDAAVQNSSCAHGVLIVLLCFVAGCSGGASGDPRQPPDSGRSVSPLRPSGAELTVRMRPPFFAGRSADQGANDDPVVAWIPPAGDTVGGRLELNPPRTIPGFHWEWNPDVPARAFVLNPDESAVWTPLAQQSFDGAEVASASGLGFAYDLTDLPLSRRWPAVVGGGNPSALVLTLAGLSPVRPIDFGQPLRLEVDLGNHGSGQEEIFFLAQAPSCGHLCVVFENMAHALDTPFVIAKSSASVFVDPPDGVPAGLRLVGVSAQPARAKSAVDADAADQENALVLAACASKWQALAAFGRDLKVKLSSYWTAPESFAAGYDVYLLQGSSGPNYQGLEHSQSTLLSIALDCGDARYSRLASGLLAHEMVHVWNVRHLIPIEHGAFNGGGFDASRTRQLYFYEGFTEGLSRVAYAELDRDLDLRANWNQSLAALHAAMDGEPEQLKVRLDVVDSEDAFRQYQTGSGLLLLVALQLRAVYEESEAQSLFWSLLERLRVESDLPSGVSSFSSNIWSRRVWNGALGAIHSAAGHSSGYETRHVVTVLRGLTGDALLDESAELDGGSIVVRQAALEQVLRAYAAATGAALETAASGALQVSVQGDRVWPF
jgi:hypothetical protein